LRLLVPLRDQGGEIETQVVVLLVRGLDRLFGHHGIGVFQVGIRPMFGFVAPVLADL